MRCLDTVGLQRLLALVGAEGTRPFELVPIVRGLRFVTPFCPEAIARC